MVSRVYKEKVLFCVAIVFEGVNLYQCDISLIIKRQYVCCNVFESIHFIIVKRTGDPFKCYMIK